MKGDFVKLNGRTAAIQRLIVLILFQSLQIPLEVQQAPILLHPRKAVQPFGAFKGEGKRAFVVGWAVKAQYHFEQREGVFTQVPLLVVSAVPLLIMKGYLNWKYKGVGVLMVCNLVFSSLSILVKMVDVARLVKCRQDYHTFLRSKVMHKHPTGNEQEDKELVVTWNLLVKHFGEEIPQDVCARAEQMGFGQTAA